MHQTSHIVLQAEQPPFEGAPVVKKGDVCIIPVGTPEVHANGTSCDSYVIHSVSVIETAGLVAE
jgi:hypothetical protein